MDLERVRTTTIIAICSDDYLLDRLVLKGGNALRLLHGIGFRTSIDIDFSLESDFEDKEEAEKRLFDSLEKNFALNNLVFFDASFYPKPKAAENDWWGGYCVEFKLIEKEKAKELGEDISRMRRESRPIDDRGQGSRKFTIDISKNEYIEGKEQAQIEGYICYVYTPHMIAAEKLRAICQQMPEYKFVKGKKRRARDFYDLHAINEAVAIDYQSKDFQAVVEKVFEAKKVPLELLGKIATEEIKDFHGTDWASTRDSIKDKGKGFDDYYQHVCKKVGELEPLWVK